MREPRYVHIAFAPVPLVHQTQIDRVVESEAFDWVRYTYNCYIIWSPSDCETILRKISQIPGMHDTSIFITAMDPNDGFANLPPFVWEWLRRDRGKHTLFITEPEQRHD